MKKNFILLFCALLLFSCNNSDNNSAENSSENSNTTTPACQTNSLPAFPGAEGFGSCATGGRGGQVLYVTNLETDRRGEIPGSLQWAVNQPGPRYILFKVSGVINTTIEILHGDLTIAGQTSPQGIIVRGLNLQGDPVCEADDCRVPTLYPQNFIVRHLRSRVEGGPAALVDQDALRFHHAVNGIIDHFSAENASDEAIQISYSRDITIQNTILAETLGGHYQYGGMLINYSDPPRGFPLTRLSIHHNMWNRIVGRLPEISLENGVANQTIPDIELSNNLIWDPGFFIEIQVHHAEGNPSDLLFYHMNFVNNRLEGRASIPDGLGNFTYGFVDSSFLQDIPAGSPTTTYVSGNTVNLYPTRSDYQLFYRNNDYPGTFLDPEHTGLPYPNASRLPSGALSSRHAFPPITYTPTSGLKDYLLAQVGAFPRDAMDNRLLDFVRRGVFDNTPRNVNAAHDAFSIPSSSTGAPLDSDNDGMPDDWERARGLNPSVQDHNGTQLSPQGYTNLEVYLNELANNRLGT